MPRPAKIWTRKNRPGWYATINGRKISLGLDRAEAERRFHALKAAGRPVARSALTVVALVDLYLDWARSEVKGTTWEAYRWLLQKWVDHAGRRKAAEIKPLDLTAWFKLCKWNASMRRHAIEVVRGWARWSKAQGYLEADILTDLRYPKTIPREAAAPGAIDAFLGAIQCERFRDVCTVLLDTGCRPGEIRTLEASQVDWAAPTARVVGKTGPRVVSLTQRSLGILARCAEQWPVGALLRNRNGDPWRSAALNGRFSRLCARLVPYHCRHAFWGRATRAGVDSVVIARQLGHSNLNMLVKHYAHPSTEQTREAVEKAQSNTG